MWLTSSASNSNAWTDGALGALARERSVGPGRRRSHRAPATGIAMVGVKSVALPRVVSEHDVQALGADDTHDVVARWSADRSAGRRRRDRGSAPRPHGRRRSDVSPRAAPPRRTAAKLARSADGSHVPFEPSVQTRRWTTSGGGPLGERCAGAELTSSGCAPTANADAGTGRSRNTSR